MALNHRRQGLIQSENDPIQTGKSLIQKEVTKRPALGDIQNRIHKNATAAEKKPAQVAGRKPILKTRQASKESTENLINKSEIIHKIETACVIKTSYSQQRIAPFIEPTITNDDPQFVSEYIKDIFAYLRSLELKYQIDELFLASHRTTTRMRSVLVNWLVEVHANFKLLPETLHLCIQILDRYLDKNKSIGRENLQLVGITALWLAGKYEEMYIPEIMDFVFIGDNSFTGKEMKSMEIQMLKALDCSFGRPLSIHFLRRYSKIANIRPQYHALAKYLLELALFECDLCFLRPSIQAAAAFFLACSVFLNPSSPGQIWTKALVHYSTYTYKDLEKTIKLLAASVVKMETSKYQAIREKYGHSDHNKISFCPELNGPAIRKFCQK